MASQTIVIRIQQVGAQQTAAGIASIGTAAKSTTSSLNFLQRSLAGVAAGFGAREILQAADAYTNLGNRVRLFTATAQETNDVQQALIDTAFEARTSVGAVSEVFQRFALVMGETGKTAKDIVGITSTLSKAIAVSGATTQEAEGALRQLSQGFSANRLSGQEFNSVIEQLPIIAVLIARELGTTTGALRGLSREGAITREVIDRAIESGGKLIDVLFQSTRVTFAQAFTNFGTALSVFIGRVNEAGGAGNLLVSSLQNFSRFLLNASKDADVLAAAIKALEVVLISLVALGIVGAVRGLASLLSTMRAVAAFNVFGSLSAAALGFGAAIGVPVAALILFRDTVIEVGDQKTTLGDLAAVIAGDVVNALESAISSAYGLADAFAEVDGEVRILPRSFKDVVDDFGSGFRIVLAGAQGTFEGIIRVFSNLPAALGAIGTAALDNLKRGLSGQDTSFFADLAAGFTAELNAGLADTERQMQARIAEELNAPSIFEGSDTFNRAAQRTREREGREAEAARLRAEADQARAEALSAFRGEGAGGGADALSKDQEKLLDSFRDLRGELDPVVALLNEYEDQNKLLADVLKNFPGLADQVSAAQAKVNEEFNKAVAELPKESEEITKLRDAMTDLRGELDPASQIAAEYAERLKQIGEAARTIPGFMAEAAELTRLATEAFTEAQAELKKQQEQLALETATGAGAIGAGFTLALQDLTANVQSQSQIIEDGFKDAFAVAGEAFKQFVETGKVDIRSLGSEILAVAAKAIAKLAVLSALNSLSGLAGGGGLGGALGGLATSLLGRAVGGPVSPGRSFIVGERGPELFTPPATGRVVPTDQLGMGGANVNVQVVNVDDPSTVPKAMGTKAGEQVILNTIQRNRGRLREVLA